MNLQSSTIYLLVVSAARNVVNHRMKSLIVGFILMFGAALLVVGTSLLASVEQSMERTVTASLAGHLQLYSAEAEDELALFGGGAFGGDDYGEIEKFGPVREAIEEVPNVRAVIPMGITTARIIGSTRLDDAIGALREAVRGEDWSQVEKLREQLTAMGEELRTEVDRRRKIEANPEQTDRQLEAIDRMLADRFWNDELRREPSESLQFLDTDIAPLSSESRLVMLRMLGTDPSRFADNFDRFQIVEGQEIPEGKRGMLVSRFIWEHHLKNSVARGLDKIKETMADEGVTIAESDLIDSTISRIKREYRTIFFGLPPDRIDKIEAKLRDFLPGANGDIKSLLQAFLSVDDQNFEARYKFFYDEIAPLIELYEFEVGDTLTLQSLGQGGFSRSANVKLWGIYSFKGLEDLELAGSMTLIDIVTFRELYGVMSQEARAELQEIQKEAGVAEVERDRAEDELFGGGGSLEVEADGGGDDPFAEVEAELAESSPDDAGLADSYDASAVGAGLARNAAVLLEDPTRISQTQSAIARVIDQKNLGLKTSNWQAAAGVVGQFVTVIRLVLYVSILIIFLVALVIINNSMVMATVERTGEIGTMRAIGAPRWYVSIQFVIETVLLGLVAGFVGSLVGSAVILIAGQTGIPASTDVLTFLFSGSHLYPTLHWWNVALGMGLIVLVSTVSTLYPAIVATRIQPVVAMSGAKH